MPESIMSPFMQVVRAHRSVISCLFALVYLPACTSWQVGTPTPAQFVQREHPATVRVTRTDGRKVVLDSPAVRGDSLVGRLADDSVRVSAMALSEVSSVAVRKTSAGKTVLLTAGILVGTLVIASLIICADPDAWC